MRQKIEQYIRSLTRREQIVLLAVVASVAAFILVAGVLSPVMSYRARLADSVRAKDDQLRKVYVLSARLRASKEQAGSGGAGAQAGFTLFGFIEDLATKARINDRIEYMKPVTDPTSSAKEAVELRLRSIYQEDLISLLYNIEHCPYPLQIKRVNIRRVEKDSNLDVVFQVVRYG